MSEEYWPHAFTKTGGEKKIGEEEVYTNMKRDIVAQEMTCVHCGVKYTHNMQPQPAGPCPARSTKREMKRILNKK